MPDAAGPRRLDPGFRWRGGGVTRIEAFSDAVFAFAVTLLVVSLEVPGTFAELRASMWSFLAFGATFAILLVIWHQHYVFFRRYGLEDLPTLWLNSALLFVVLFYIYPLKFLMGFLLDLVAGPAAAMADGRVGGLEDVALLMVIYAAGYMAVWLLLALLYRHALRRREALALAEREVVLTRASAASCLVQAGAAALSVAIVLVAPPAPLTFLVAGSAYWLLGPALWLLGRRVNRTLAALPAEAPGGP